MKTLIIFTTVLLTVSAFSQETYQIVDTAQKRCFDNVKTTNSPDRGNQFYGQDAQFNGNQPKYKSGGGMVTDQVTGLVWLQKPVGKKTYLEAMADARDYSRGGYKDWRLPSVKELCSLMNFNGIAGNHANPKGGVPFIDTNYFTFNYGNPKDNSDVLYVTRTKCVSNINGSKAVYAVNFADGTVRAYPIGKKNAKRKFNVIYVRGNESYGENTFSDNDNGTISDLATGLMWSTRDSRKPMTWQNALVYAKKSRIGGHSDWRLPNVKELQSIVDYNRSPDKTKSAAIDPVFASTPIKNELEQTDFPYYWTSTTLQNQQGGLNAVYIAFGRALGYLRSGGSSDLIDANGVGAILYEPKNGKKNSFTGKRGPQGEVMRVFNYVRLVRGGKSSITKPPKTETKPKASGKPKSKPKQPVSRKKKR